MEENSETLKETFKSETQSPLFDEFFFNLNATPLTTKRPENSMHPLDEGDLQTPTTVATDANKFPAKSKFSKKPWRRGTKKESKVKIGLMEGPDLPEWLPQGWQMERKKRENGVKTGMVETFYYDPEKGLQFRSKSAVLLFLESGTRRKRKSAQRRPKEILAEPTNNFNIPTQASTSKSYIDSQLELAPHVSSIDANGSENLNPVIGNETVPKQTMDDQNADFEERVSKPDNLDDGIVQTPTRPTVMIESFEKSNSVKSWRRSGAVGTSLKLEIIEGVDLPEWLPQGCKMERKVRQNGASAGMIDAIVEDFHFPYEMYQLQKLKATKFEALFRASEVDLEAKVEEVRVLEAERQEDLQLRERVRTLEQKAQVLEERHQADLQLGERVKDLEHEAADLRDHVHQLKGDLDETVQKAQMAVGNLSAAEVEVMRLRAQVEGHEAEVVQVQLEARDRYAELVKGFLAKVKEDTGKTYKLKL